MRKVFLRMNEQSKYDVIKKVVNKEITVLRATVLLNVVERTIYKLMNVYKTKGKEGFIHGNRGRKPSTTISQEIKEKIINLYSTDTFSNANYNHFKELLQRNDIKISYNCLYKVLTDAGFISPKCQRKTKREYNKKLKQKIQEKEKLKAPELDYIAITNLDDIKDSHPRRPRSKYLGECLQMDACECVWFGTKKYHLHAAIDDATGAIMGAYFDNQETLNGYYNVFYQILINYGIPAKFLTDRRTVFEYKRLKNPSDEKDTFTQFGYACSRLGTEIETSSVPQVKGRVERLFNTLQSRLPVELRVRGIIDVDSANEFLNSYIKEFNDQFSTINYYTKSVFDKQIDSKKINYTLSVISTRIVDKGNSISFKRKTYQCYDRNGLVCIKPKTMCLVIKTFDNKLLCCIGEDVYELVELQANYKHSKTFDKKKDKPNKYTGHKPPYFHPWTYISYKERMKQYQKRHQKKVS